MNKCLLCKSTIPINRKKYCSTACVKRAWYIRNTTGRCFFKSDPAFWNTETGIGFTWEKYAAEKLNATHLKFNSKGADLEKNGEFIDVKSCNLYRRKNRRGSPVKTKQAGNWVFNRNKLKDNVDWFFCICLDKNKVVKEYMIPAHKFGIKGVTIGNKSAFDEFLFI